jgi:hypothetical protein
MMLSFKQFILEAVEADLDMKKYGAWLNIKTGETINVRFEGHAEDDVLKKMKLTPYLRRASPERKRLMRQPAFIVKETDWVRIIFPTKYQKDWDIQSTKKNKNRLWKFLGTWFDDDHTVFLDDETGLLLGKFDLNMPADKRAIRQTMGGAR